MAVSPFTKFPCRSAMQGVRVWRVKPPATAFTSSVVRSRAPMRPRTRLSLFIFPPFAIFFGCKVQFMVVAKAGYNASALPDVAVKRGAIECAYGFGVNAAAHLLGFFLSEVAGLHPCKYSVLFH